MLYISRWKAAAMLFTVLSVSAMAIPSFLPEKTFQSLPKWVQNRIVPGIEYQGGVRQLLEVDAVAVRKEKIDQLRDEVRKVLREAKVGLLQAPVVRGGSVEVRIRNSDLERGLATLHERLVLPFQGDVRAVPQIPIPVVPGTPSVVSVTRHWLAPNLPAYAVIEPVGGGLVRLAVTEAAIQERVQQARWQSMEIISRRMQELGVVGLSVELRGTDRIEIVVPGLRDPRWFDLMG